MEHIVYLRVSTQQQGISGLGLAAQKQLVMSFLGNTQPLAEFIEVESGKRHKNRPQLLAALELCKKKKAKLVIAKLDRLSRNVAFISSLMESGVDFVCCDNPHANRLMLHMLAALAEHERELISERVKAALARVKADLLNGPRVSQSGKLYTKLGGPRLSDARAKAAALKLANQPSERTARFMLDLWAHGVSLRALAIHLNQSDIRTPHGSRWYASTVRTALSRLPDFQKDRKDGSSNGRNPERGISGETLTSRLNGSQSGAIPAHAVPNGGRRTPRAGENDMADLNEAFRMIDAFASVGATHFDVTFTDIDGEKCGFRKDQTARQLRNSLPHLLPGLTERKQNLIVRPHSDKVDFIQLDDLDQERLKPLAPVSCLILETSPCNHQAWIAVSDLEAHEAKDFARRLRKGTGADATASGATRCSGTSNYKRKYEPEFPIVKILQAAPGRLATKEQLESLGLVASSEAVHVAVGLPFRVSSAGRSWPDYQRCVLGAPQNHNKSGPDISRADFFFALLSAQRNHSIDEIADRLMEVSTKAQENGPQYARLTAENAIAATERQRKSRA